MASQHCVACGDFHLSVAVRRSAPNPRKYGIDIDQESFVTLIGKALNLRRGGNAPLTVLIVGAADTAILKGLLDAALRVGGETCARSLDITVVDLCETPLEMCRVFAARQGLAIGTERADIGAFRPQPRYGLVVMHGVLPFFPVDRRLDYMQRIVGWLDPQGLVVSSSQIAETRSSRDVDKEIATRVSILKTFLATEANVVVDLQAMVARLKRAAIIRSGYPRVFDDETALRLFYSKAGLTLLDRHLVDAGEDGTPRHYAQRAVVLGQKS